MVELSKAARKAIRDAAGLAYQRELCAALEDLGSQFAKWESGEINAFELSDLIHEFHQGISRELFKRYDGTSVPDFAVAGAVLRGSIKESEIPEAGREHVMKIVSLSRGQ